MDKLDYSIDSISSVADYLNDLYKKQGGNLNTIGAKSLDKATQQINETFNKVVFSLAVHSHRAIVTFINDLNQEHDANDVTADSHSAIAHTESLALTLYNLGLDNESSTVDLAKANIETVTKPTKKNQLQPSFLDKAQNEVDSIMNQFRPKA